MQRAKTDAKDALLIMDYAERMPFVPWQAPSEHRLQLQALTSGMTKILRARNSIESPRKPLDLLREYLPRRHRRSLQRVKRVTGARGVGPDKERLFQFLKPRAYSAIGLDFLDKPLKPVALLVNVNRT